MNELTDLLLKKGKESNLFIGRQYTFFFLKQCVVSEIKGHDITPYFKRHHF